MRIQATTTDEAVLHELGERLAATRLAANLSQAGLAEQAGLSKRTIERLESGEVATQLSSLVRVCRVLGLLERFDLLIAAPAASPMARIRRQGKPRLRASGARRTAAKKKKWTWAETVPGDTTPRSEKRLRGGPGGS